MEEDTPYDIEEGDTELMQILKLTMIRNPELLSLSFATKNGILVKSVGPELDCKRQTRLLALLCDKTRAVAREFKFKDELRFVTIRTTKTEYLICVEEKFLFIASLKPTFRNEGEPEIDMSKYKD